MSVLKKQLIDWMNSNTQSRDLDIDPLDPDNFFGSMDANNC